MRRSRRRLVLETVTTLLYVAGVVVVLTVGVRGYLALEANAPEALTVLDLALFGAGVGLLVAARRLSPGLEGRLTVDPHTRVGRHEPEPSKLEALGYRVPPEQPDTDRTTAYEDGTLYRLCPACEERNETDFDYCRRCSTKLEP